MAMTTQNEHLQWAIVQLQEGKLTNQTTLQAKLAKELITLAEKYKVPELTFDTKATKRRVNYLLWISKILPILAMFPQTNQILKDFDVTSYDHPEDIGNKALYLLISAKVDEYFQRAIKKFEGYGDKALSFIKNQSTDSSLEDTHQFHHLFSTLQIKDNESATNFFKRFTFAQMEAEVAGNTNSEEQLFALAGFTSTHNTRYETALQLYRLERERDSKKKLHLHSYREDIFQYVRTDSLQQCSYQNCLRSCCSISPFTTWHFEEGKAA
jgi:hypothetical protein